MPLAGFVLCDCDGERRRLQFSIVSSVSGVVVEDGLNKYTAVYAIVCKLLCVVSTIPTRIDFQECVRIYYG